MNSESHILLNREEAAKFLGLKTGTLSNWATTKRYELPMVKVGRLVRYKKEDLENFLKQRTV